MLTTPLPILDAAGDHPLFGWNPKVGKYFYKESGRFVPQSAVENLAKGRIEATRKDIGTLASMLVDGKISLSTWQSQTADSLKVLHSTNYLLGRGGKNQMEKSDYLAIARELKNQYKYLRGVSQDLQEGTMTISQFLNRMTMYADSGTVSYHEAVETVHKSSTGATKEQRILGDAEHCEDCLEYAEMGVVDIGTLPNPGQECACGSRCRCRKKFFRELGDGTLEALHSDSSETGKRAHSPEKDTPA